MGRLRSVTGSTRETNLRPAFARLLRAWGKQELDLVFVEEHQIRTPQGNLISVDGVLLHALRVPFGYWEAKDKDDKLDDEIANKFRKGYPRDNIIFSDDHTAVLYQDGSERLRVPMDDTEALYPLMIQFFAHERQEIADFNKAVKKFANDLPAFSTPCETASQRSMLPPLILLLPLPPSSSTRAMPSIRPSATKMSAKC